MSRSRQYRIGEHLVLCDVCGFTYHSSEMRRGVAEGQKGLKVCPRDYDPPHPNEKKRQLRPVNPFKDID